jgi:hypothetical protein
LNSFGLLVDAEGNFRPYSYSTPGAKVGILGGGRGDGLVVFVRDAYHDGAGNCDSIASYLANAVLLLCTITIV